MEKTFSIVKGKRIISTPKTEESIRQVSIPQFLYDELTEYVSLLYGIKPNERIFTYTKSALNAEIKRLATAAKLEPIRVHDLRHSHVSMLFNMDAKIIEISKRVGHGSSKFTLDTYGHLYKDRNQKLASEIHERKCSASSKEN